MAPFLLLSIQIWSARTFRSARIPARRPAAIASVAWQPEPVQDLKLRAGGAKAQVVSAVGNPPLSKQGIALNRCPVERKTKLPVEGFVTLKA